MGPTLEQADACETPGLRAVFLERASARLLLYEAGAMTLDEAINGLAPAFRTITGIADCACDREMRERWDRYEQRYLAALKKRKSNTTSKPNTNWKTKR